MLIPRGRHITELLRALERSPAVAILGARQVGKTTLAQVLASQYQGHTTHLDLEDPDHLARLDEPKLALAPLKGLVIIDEIQRRPELFQVLRVLVDRPDTTTRFLILGSASPELLQQSSETMAGRIAYHELGGFSLDEVGMEAAEILWLRGGFPRSFLAGSDDESLAWRRDFIRTFLERDLPQLGIRTGGVVLHRFWRMLAHYHGQIWNGAELARAFGVSHSTVRNYLNILSGALVVHPLPPWHENLGKRQVKSPKVYLADSGLLHALLGIGTPDDLEGHPKVGASWEGFVLGELIQRLGAQPEDCYFWATHAGAELDLLVVRGKQRLGFEIKRTTTPRMTPSIRSALKDLRLERLTIIHAGDHSFPLAERVHALPLMQLYDQIKPL